LVKPLAIAVLSARTAYGAGLIAAPEPISAAWLGPAASTAPVHVPVRGLGAREAILNGAALAGPERSAAAATAGREHRRRSRRCGGDLDRPPPAAVGGRWQDAGDRRRLSAGQRRARGRARRMTAHSTDALPEPVDPLRRPLADVVMTKRVGSHGVAFWREEFSLMVAWAFGR
jgi:hypothetical protein